MNPLKRLFSYTLRFKFSFFLSILGFILFASADIAAVEWLRQIIAYINSDKTDFSIYLVLSLTFIAIGRGIGFFSRFFCFITGINVNINCNFDQCIYNFLFPWVVTPHNIFIPS